MYKPIYNKYLGIPHKRLSVEYLNYVKIDYFREKKIIANLVYLLP